MAHTSIDVAMVVTTLGGTVVILGTVIKSLTGKGKGWRPNGNGKRFSEAIRIDREKARKEKAEKQTDEIHRALMQPGTNGAPFITNSINEGLETLKKIHTELRDK